MRLRLMATYLGIPYQASLGPDGNQVTLFSPGPPPEDLGFVAGPGHWRKEVSVCDLDALWQSRPTGEYRGEPCLVLDDFGDRLHIAYLGRDATQAAQLGYWEIDREVYEVVVARHDVIGLVEERVDFPLAAATFPASGPPGPPPPSGPSGLSGLSGPSGPSGPVVQAGPPAAVAADPGGHGGPAGNGGGAAAGHAGGLAEYPGAAPGNDGVAAGNSRPEGYGGSDHASRMPDRVAAWHGSPAPEPWPGPAVEAGTGSGPWPVRDPRSGLWPVRDPGRVPPGEPWTERQPEAGRQPETGREQEGGRTETEGAPGPGRSTVRKDRISPESVFAELLNLAAIPHATYAVDEEVPGAMCLVEADGGFEVFSRTDDARLEVRFFEDEEAAYFYLFGVLAAEAIRSGRLAPSGPDRANGNHNGAARPGTSASTENVSKYLRGRKLP
jgi:hypothetical protein